MGEVEPENQTSAAEQQAFGARIAELVGEAGSGRQLAIRAGVSPQAARNWMLGTADPSRANIVALATAFGVEVLWLATGRGPKRAPPGAALPLALAGSPFLPPVYEGSDDIKQEPPEEVRREVERRKGVSTISLRVPPEVTELAPAIVPGDLVFGIYDEHTSNAKQPPRPIFDGDGLYVLVLPPLQRNPKGKEAEALKKLLRHPRNFEQLSTGACVRYLKWREPRGVIASAFADDVKSFDLTAELATSWARGRILAVVRPSGVRPVVSKPGVT